MITLDKWDKGIVHPTSNSGRRCLFGSGPAKVAESVTKGTGEAYGIEQARDDIKTYFDKFSTLKKCLDSRKKFIETNGYTYSHFGRKRRLTNVFSADKGIAAHEVRSGINSEIQSCSSDVNLLAAMDTQDECEDENIDARIFMLVHDSIVAVVKIEDVEAYSEILTRNTKKDHGCSIPGFPIGTDIEIGDDYSFGKFDKTYYIEGDCLIRTADTPKPDSLDMDEDEQD